MDINSLFITPDEDMDLATLRIEVNRTYRSAFKQMREELNNLANPSRISTIVNETINEVDRLIEKHNDKHHPKQQPKVVKFGEPF